MNSDALQILGDILVSPVDTHRCAAARALGRMALPGTVDVLIPALLDEDPDVRADAAEALRQLGDAGAVTQLWENLLGDPEPDVKKPALAALIALRADGITELLRELAVSRTDRIAWDEDEFYTEGWDSWVDLQLMAIRGLGELECEEAVGDILTAMADEEGQDVYPVGIPALARMGDDGARALEQLFEAGDAQLCRRIAEATVSSPTKDDTAFIDRMLESEHARVREIALRGVANDDPRLADLFQDPDAQVRAAAVAHAGIAFPDLVAALITDDSPAVRERVFETIALRPDLFAGDDMAESVQKAIAGEPRAALAAARALLALRGRKSLKGLTHAMTNAGLPLEFRVGAAEVLKQAGMAAVPFLLRAAGDPERRMRLAALTALADLAENAPTWPNAAGDGLLAALRGELVEPPEESEDDAGEADKVAEGPVSVEADPVESEVESIDPETGPDAVSEEDPDADLKLSTLDAILAPQPVSDDAPAEEVVLTEEQQRLVKLAEQNRRAKRKIAMQVDVAPHLDVRRYAASLLGKLRADEVKDALLEAASEADPELRDNALDALVQIGETDGGLPGSVLPALNVMLDRGPTEAKVLALRAAALVEDPKAATLIDLHVADPDPQVRTEAFRARARRGTVDEVTEAALFDAYAGVGLIAARSLAEARGPAAANALIEFACTADGTHRDLVGELLGRHAGDAGIDLLLDQLRDEERLRYRLVLIDALAAAWAVRDGQRELKAA